MISTKRYRSVIFKRVYFKTEEFELGLKLKSIAANCLEILRCLNYFFFTVQARSSFKLTKIKTRPFIAELS